jgi:hypothetical protein
MFDAGSIVGRLVLDTSGFTASAVQATNKIEKIGESIVSTSRQLSRMASALTYLGAGITTPIVAAFKSAEKYSNSTRLELEKMNDTFIGLRVSIAESLLPIMHQFGNAIADLAQRWQALSPALRESMLRTALLTGVFLTLGGAIAIIALKIGTLVGKVIELSGAFAAFAIINPELLLIRIAIAAIVIAMFKWKEVGDIVMNTFQIIFNIAKAGLSSILYLTNSITSAFFAAATGAAKFFAVTKNGEAKKAWNEIADSTWKVAQQYSDLANNNLKNVANAGVNTFNVLTTGQSDFSRGFDDMKTQAQSWIDLFKNLGSQEIGVKDWQESSKTFAQGWQDAWTQTLAQLQNWGATAENTVQEIASGMRSSFSNLFQGLFKGDAASFSEFMNSIGDLFLKTISDMIAQMIVLFFWQKLTGLLFSGSSTITGGVGGTTTQTAQFGTVWSPSFAEGTDSIPYTGTYRLHEGEKVTPKYDATKGDAIELTIVNQITPEAVATAMSGKEGQGVIVNTINTDALRNGTTRKTIRRK